MKFFAFIMASLVLVLSCMPCTDGASAMKSTKVELSKCSNQERDNHSDDCSPFCTCNCCSGFTISIISYKIGNYILPSVERNVNNHSQNISNISLPIWQPPQLS